MNASICRALGAHIGTKLLLSGNRAQSMYVCTPSRCVSSDDLFLDATSLQQRCDDEKFDSSKLKKRLMKIFGHMLHLQANVYEKKFINLSIKCYARDTLSGYNNKNELMSMYD